MSLARPIFVALDIDDTDRAVELAGQLSGLVGFKLGPRLLIRQGQDLVQSIARYGPVFVDNKYFDIPNTMESAVRATFEAGASFCTVHAQSGSEALQRMAGLEKHLNQLRPFKILSVTILTSFSKQTLPSVLRDLSIQDQVKELAQLTFASGLTGLVCSPFEVETIKGLFPHGYFVTPGVRPEGLVAGDDQKRVMTPEQALKKGASALVIGRPIVEAENPLAATKEILKRIKLETSHVTPTSK